MDLEKYLIDVKTLVTEDQQLREEVSALKLEVAIEEQDLKMLRIQEEKIAGEIANLARLRDFKRSELENIKADRARLNKTELQRSLLKTCLNNMAPAAELQVDRFKALQAEYQKLLHLYEQQPLYQEILQESAQQRALEDHIKKFEEEEDKDHANSNEASL